MGSEGLDFDSRGFERLANRPGDLDGALVVAVQAQGLRLNRNGGTVAGGHPAVFRDRHRLQGRRLAAFEERSGRPALRKRPVGLVGPVDEPFTREGNAFEARRGSKNLRVGESHEGDPAAEILAQVKADPEIGVLVLGAGTDKSGPGPLVTQMSRNSGSLPIPITIVPGDISKERLESIT